MGFVEVTTSSGPGLADTRYASYERVRTLDGHSHSLMQRRTTATCRRRSPRKRSAGRVRGNGRATGPQCGGQCRATIAIHSVPGQTFMRPRKSQMLLTFLSECANSDDARILASAARGQLGRTTRSRLNVIGSSRRLSPNRRRRNGKRRNGRLDPTVRASRRDVQLLARTVGSSRPFRRSPFRRQLTWR